MMACAFKWTLVVVLGALLLTATVLGMFLIGAHP
jgi:hypothetical protein